MKRGGFLPEDLARIDLPSPAVSLVRLLKALGFLAYVCDVGVGIVGHQIDTDEERHTWARRWSRLWDTEHLFLEPASTFGRWRWNHHGPSPTVDEIQACESQTVGDLFESILAAMGRPKPWLERWAAVSSNYVDRGRAAMNGGG